MRFHELREAMTRDEAERIFQRFGVNAATLTPDALKTAYRGLVKQHHPDLTGDSAALKLVNAAYDELRQDKPAIPRGAARGGAAGRPPPARDGAPWSRAGYSGGAPNSDSIYRNDYRDMNFIKKRMWELSGQSKEQWTIWGFDGSYLRNSLTVYGNAQIFHDMAEAMVTWQTRGGNPYDCRAVLVQRREGRGSGESTAYIIWADGVFYDSKPIPIDYDSFNRNPGNDQSFAPRLRALIDKLKAD